MPNLYIKACNLPFGNSGYIETTISHNTINTLVEMAKHPCMNKSALKKIDFIYTDAITKHSENDGWCFLGVSLPLREDEEPELYLVGCLANPVMYFDTNWVPVSILTKAREDEEIRIGMEE